MTSVVFYFDKHNTKPSKKKSNNDDMHEPMKMDLKKYILAASLNLIA